MFPTFAVAQNGTPKAILNLTFVSSERSYPFLNFVKAGQQISNSTDSRETPIAALVNQDGYLTETIDTAQNVGGFRYPLSFKGYWALKWTSTGASQVTLTQPIISDFDGGPTGVTRSATGAQAVFSASGAGDHRVTFKISDETTGNLAVIALKHSISNLVMVQADPKGLDRTENLKGTEEWLLSKGEIFRPDFIRTMRLLNPWALRLMQWANCELSLNGLFECENPPTAIGYGRGTGRFDPRLWCGDATTNSQPEADSYSVTPPSSYPGGFPTTKTHGSVLQFRIKDAGQSADNICQSQKPTVAGDLTLNGALVTGGVATFSQARKVGIRSTESETSRTFTVSGHVDGVADTEDVTGGAKNKDVFTTKEFDDVTGVSVDGATTGNIVVGTKIWTINPGGSWGDVRVKSPVDPSVDVTSGPAANEMLTMTYDSVLDRFFYKADIQHYVSVPLQIQVALCNKLNRNLFWNVPFLYSNASVAKAVDYIAKNLKPGLKCIVEPYNEWWNSIYYGTVYGIQIGNVVAPGTGNPGDSGYAWWFLQLFKSDGPVIPTWAAVRPRNELIVLLACQVGAFNHHQRILADELADPPEEGSRPIDICDGYACAYYTFGPLVPNPGGGNTPYNHIKKSARQALWDAAEVFATGDPAKIQAAFKVIDDDLRNGSISGANNGNTIAARIESMDSANTVCDTYGVTPANGKGFYWYEGSWNGVEPDAATLMNFCKPTATIEDNGDGTGTMTVTAVDKQAGSDRNNIEVGLTVVGDGVAEGTVITALGTGTGGTGTYTVTPGQDVSSTQMTVGMSEEDADDLATKVKNLIYAYRSSKLYKDSMRYQFDQFMERSNSLHPCWYNFNMGPQGAGTTGWFGMIDGDLYDKRLAPFHMFVEFNNQLS